MKTDAKTMVEVLRKVADNIENSLDKNDSIQAMYVNNEWEDRTTNDLCFSEDVKYRIKPKTITVNGVEIPKPLDKNEIIESSIYYSVNHNCNLFGLVGGDRALKEKIIFIYKDQEEAIEASKKLFGIE